MLTRVTRGIVDVRLLPGVGRDNATIVPMFEDAHISGRGQMPCYDSWPTQHGCVASIVASGEKVSHGFLAPMFQVRVLARQPCGFPPVNMQLPQFTFAPDEIPIEPMEAE